jgi:hypothetical protein
MTSESNEGEASGTENLIAKADALLLQGGTVESTVGSGPIAEPVLTKAVAAMLDQLTTYKTSQGAGTSPPASDGGADAATMLAAQSAVGRAQAALSKIKGGEAPSSLSADDVSAIELIVYTIGRPALRFKNGRVESPPNKLGDNSRWFVMVATERDKINRLSSCVGRITCEHGATAVPATGWRIGPEFIVTNRHVACDLVVDRHAPVQSWKTDAAKRPFVDFAYTDQTTGPARLDIGELVFCAPEGDIDIAVFRLLARNAPLPPAIPIDWDDSTLGRTLPATSHAMPVFQGGEVYAVGHPYRAVASAETRKVFDQADGRKRWSPGLVTGIDPQRPILFHDGSTLSGNSGSCVIAMAADGRHVAVGLHYGAKELAMNKGSGLGSANYAIAFARIAAHPAAQFLRSAP